MLIGESLLFRIIQTNEGNKLRQKKQLMMNMK